MHFDSDPLPNLGLKILSDKGVKHLYMGDLNAMPQKISLHNETFLEIEGTVNWKTAKGFCLNHGRNIMVSPTEELASMLAGIATSASGERSFGFSTLRHHVREIEFIDFEGNEKTLKAQNLLSDYPLFKSKRGKELLEAYQNAYQKYEDFKNGPSLGSRKKQTSWLVWRGN